MTESTRLAFRTCPLCEATCGLEITLRPAEAGGEEVVRIRGDRDDVFSGGFLCPKGSTLRHLHEDPDRLRRPVVRGEDGGFHEVSWDEAWRVVADGLSGVVERHGRGAVAGYFGNPSGHNLGSMLYLRYLVRALRTPAVFSASTVDQRPKEISTGLMFGTFTLPVPDVDRTDFLLMLGANPFASNGSLATAPDWPGRLERLVARGGTLVVVDPRRTRTAEMASEWVPIRPGTDALLLAALVHVLFADGLVRLGAVAGLVAGIDEVAAAVEPFSPEAVADAVGVAAPMIHDLAHRLAGAPTAAVYGRMGTCAQAFGTLASWLVDVLNIVTGNLDRPGGAMFAKPAVGSSNTRGAGGRGKGTTIHRRHTRVRGLPEAHGEFPVAALAEEIDTPGDGQLRGFVCIAGNPVLSTPNSARLDAALSSLEFMVAVDMYVNETTRHADVILPVPSALQKAHYDIVLSGMSLRNVANWSDPVLPLDDDQLDEWEVLAKLALVAEGTPDAEPSIIDDRAYEAVAKHAHDDVRAAVLATGRTGPARMVDMMLRTGPYGLTLDDLIAAPHGIDLGPLRPRLPEALRTPSGMIELAPPLMITDMRRLAGVLTAPLPETVLIGRRDLRSNNSWMHNVEVLVKGKPRCTMHIHPDDAERLGLVDGEPATLVSRVGRIDVPVEITDAIRPGVVSVPHGWGHTADGVRLGVAQRHPGINSNVLTDEAEIDWISGTSVLNGIPVTVSRASI